MTEAALKFQLVGDFPSCQHDKVVVVDHLQQEYMPYSAPVEGTLRELQDYLATLLMDMVVEMTEKATTIMVYTVSDLTRDQSNLHLPYFPGNYI